MVVYDEILNWVCEINFGAAQGFFAGPVRNLKKPRDLRLRHAGSAAWRGKPGSIYLVFYFVTFGWLDNNGDLFARF